MTEDVSCGELNIFNKRCVKYTCDYFITSSTVYFLKVELFFLGFLSFSLFSDVCTQKLELQELPQKLFSADLRSNVDGMWYVSNGNFEYVLLKYDLLAFQVLFTWEFSPRRWKNVERNRKKWRCTCDAAETIYVCVRSLNGWTDACNCEFFFAFFHFSYQIWSFFCVFFFSSKYFFTTVRIHMKTHYMYCNCLLIGITWIVNTFVLLKIRWLFLDLPVLQFKMYTSKVKFVVYHSRCYRFGNLNKLTEK